MLVYDLFESWTEKYKRSIDCSDPKGFSQRAHCDGRKKQNESALTLMDGFRELLPIAVKHLNLPTIPKIHLNKEQSGTHQASFGGYDSGTDDIHLSISNRHPVDVLRTLAHELVHYKQKLAGELVDDSWKTGSPAENEANAVAGVIMRLFNKQNPEFMAVKPIVEDINAKIDLKKALDQLPEKEREMIIMRMYHDATYAEIGREFNVTPQTVRMRIEKGLRLLRQMRHGYTSEYVPKDLKRVGDDDDFYWQRPFDEVPMNEHIRKQGNKYVVYSKDRKRKFGTYTSRADAEKRLRQIEMFKHMNEMSHREAEKILKKNNYHLERTHGAHDVYKDDEGHTFALPRKHHAKDLSKGVEHQLKKEITHENFADGKVKGKSRPGRVKKAGASCKGSVTDLRAKAKKYSGEKGKMYHWCANMKKD